MENFCDCFLKYIKNNEESLNTFVKNVFSARYIKNKKNKEEIIYYFKNQNPFGFGVFWFKKKKKGGRAKALPPFC